MKKLFILLSICLLAPFAVQAQRVNKNGLKMVSRVFDYSGCLGGRPDIYTFQYDENDELERVTFVCGRGHMVFKKNGNTIDISSSVTGYYFSCKLNEDGLIQEILYYDTSLDGSGDDMVDIEEFQYDYNGGQYRLASIYRCTKIAWKGKPREEWTYATPGEIESHDIREFDYPVPDQLLKIYKTSTTSGRMSPKRGDSMENSEFINDTNFNLRILEACNKNFDFVAATEWCGYAKSAFSFFVSGADAFVDKKIGFDKKGNFVGIWVKKNIHPDPAQHIWKPRFMVEYVDGTPIETDQYGNDLRPQNE